MRGAVVVGVIEMEGGSDAAEQSDHVAGYRRNKRDVPLSRALLRRTWWSIVAARKKEYGITSLSENFGSASLAPKDGIEQRMHLFLRK